MFLEDLDVEEIKWSTEYIEREKKCFAAIYNVGDLRLIIYVGWGYGSSPINVRSRNLTDYTHFEIRLGKADPSPLPEHRFNIEHFVWPSSLHNSCDELDKHFGAESYATGVPYDDVEYIMWAMRVYTARENYKKEHRQKRIEAQNEAARRKNLQYIKDNKAKWDNLWDAANNEYWMYN